MEENNARENNPREAQAPLSPPLPVPAAALLARLDALGIAYDLHEHAPVFTVAESEHLTALIPGIHCRNLFLRDRKKAMFLVVAPNETPVDLKALQGALGCDRLSFGSADRLWEFLGVRPGSVCPFAIVNDTQRRVAVWLDREMMAGERVCYHPMENHLTVSLAPADLLKFIESCGHTPHIIDLKQAAPVKETKECC